MLAEARSALEQEDFASARALFMLLADLPESQESFQARAYLAYLDYYRGDFETGRIRALSVPRDAPRIARAEAALYASVNLIALNRSADAMRYAFLARNLGRRLPLKTERTDLCFRAQRQLVHVLVARGDYTSAFAEARAAHELARDGTDSRRRGLAAYLLGVVEAATGDRGALMHLREADRAWGGSSHAFGKWLKYFSAMTMRDQEEPVAADQLRLASGMALVWEEPLFELALGHHPKTLEIDGCPADETPFRLATNGILALVSNEPRRALNDLAAATDEFLRLQLVHHGRGAAMGLAAAYIVVGDMRSAMGLLAEHLGALQRMRVTRWPWWHPPIVRRILRFAQERGLHPGYCSLIATSMRHIQPDTETILRVRDLTGRETAVVLAWLSEPGATRRELAERLEISEATLRNHLNSVRRKLGCDARRGLDGIRSRLAEATDRYTGN
jgi:DNA-binding CsgD family transcriptional regulator